MICATVSVVTILSRLATLRSWSALAAVSWVGFACWLLTADSGARATNIVVNVVETLVPLIAGVICMRAGRVVSVGRATWRLGGAGVFAWGLGQAVWSWYEVVLRQEVPFPSLADIGYLTFPVLASLGIAVYHTRGRPQRRSVAAGVDGALLAASLCAISWFALLQGLVESGSPTAFDFWLLVAYPVGDVILLTMALHTVAKLRVAPTSLLLLCLGLAVMAVADSAFVWLVESGSFTTGGWVDLAWISAFALIGGAGWQAHHEWDIDEAMVDVTRFSLMLPYIPFAVGIVVIAGRVGIDTLGRSEGAFAGLLTLLVLIRQYLALADNQALLASLRAREGELQHLALHDPLTGLANRTLLADRLEHAGTARGAPTGASLLLIDLDNFKAVNDRYGHAAGDQLLVTAANRLTQCVRAHDTVARLGGDEFAVLLAPPSDSAETVARRILASLSAPILLDGGRVQLSASVGIGDVLLQDHDAEGSSRAMRRADIAMYAAKAAGRNRWRRYTPDGADVATSAAAAPTRQPLEASDTGR